MKILLLGEYSNVHATLAEGLRELGHKVTLLSNGDFWKDYPRDIDLVRVPTKIGGIKYFAKLLTILPRLRGYDVVQIINPMFLELKAERIFPTYKYLRKHNGKMFMGAFGMDYYWVNTCITSKPLRYSDFNIGDTIRHDPPAEREYIDWLGTEKERLNKYIAYDCDGIVSGLYEYDVCYRPVFPQKTTFIPYPIKIPNAPEVQSTNQQKIKFFIGISKSRSTYKGTDIMWRALIKLQNEHPDKVEIIRAEGVPFDEYEKMMNRADVVLDQIYSYTPAMNGLLAMSKGKVLVGGGEEENYEILGENELRPIINVQPNEQDVYKQLHRLVAKSKELPMLQQQSVEYIRRHHDYIKVAKQYVEMYKTAKRL
ncbi:MAG: glycosyltransferase family 1 protein [Prevotellaceae bacterium]|nr:glycosyltransferase family 1 protein [Prevotellaceae bacterium]